MGGGSGAGKTTVAGLLAERFGLQLYSSDARIPIHSARLSAPKAPLLDRFRRMSMDERWVQRDPETMYQTFPWFHGEGFDLLIEDLRNLSKDRVVLAEGFRLLPHLVQAHLSEPRHAVWLLPTPNFRRAVFTNREPAAAFWSRTTNPQQALANLLERDRIFNDAVADDAAGQGLRTLQVDGTRTVEEMAEALATAFAPLR